MSQSTTNISLVAAFSAGLLSFVSPCVLPLIPSYISYITGLSIEQLTDSTLRSKFKKLLSSTGADRRRRRIIALAHEYGRYGYRRITALLQQEGWRVNRKHVERLWRQEGLQVPQKQPKRARLWLADGSCIRRRAEYPNPVWSYNFVMDRTQDGRPLKLLTIVDEYTRECLAIAVRRRLRSQDGQEVLAE
jgi:transposase InsO family protein